MNVKRSAFVYFVGLATVNIIFTWYNVGFKWLDLTTIVIALLPFVINKKIMYLLFGLLASFISLYLMLGCLIFSLNPNVQTPATDLLMGFVLTGLTLLFSIGLLYVGLQTTDKDRFSLI